jgi:hypothetical protein
MLNVSFLFSPFLFSLPPSLLTDRIGQAALEELPGVEDNNVGAAVERREEKRPA